MKTKTRIFSVIITVIIALTVMCPSAFAREFAPVFDANNIGVQTQYKYDKNDPSWLRQLVIKEDMLSSNGLFSEEVLHPICSYPYNIDAPGFKAQVAENIELFTLDEDSQKAAYLYLLEQLGALSIIANPETSDKSKADWLREQGIIITEEDEKDPDKAIMISALYALMQNDFYYVITGERLKIPKGTTLEEATVMYLMALSGNNTELLDFVRKYFGNSSIGSLEDYIYYTSLMALFAQGYVTPAEIPTITKEEVYRRVAVMTIRNAGIAIDAETATTEEIRYKYIAAMMGTQYSVTVDPDAFKRATDKGEAAFYILQRMAYEDANVTISSTKHSYEECFKIVLKKTNRFDLENEFYSDIFEYDVHLDNLRKFISINPNPISSSGVSITINGVDVRSAAYAQVDLTGKEKETITIVSRQTTGKDVETSVYKVNVYQGKTAPPDSDLTGIIPTLGDLTVGNNTQKVEGGTSSPKVTLSGNVHTMAPTDALNQYNDATFSPLNSLLTLNKDGQLVDQNGNVVSDSTYETLPPGYEYVINEDGVVTVIQNEAESTSTTTTLDPTEPTTTEETPDNSVKVDTLKIVTIVSFIFFLLILIAIIVVLIISKKKNTINNKKNQNESKSEEIQEKDEL